MTGVSAPVATSTEKTLMPPPLPLPMPGPDVHDATYANSRLPDWAFNAAALAVKVRPATARKSRRERWLLMGRNSGTELGTTQRYDCRPAPHRPGPAVCRRGAACARRTPEDRLRQVRVAARA